MKICVFYLMGRYYRFDWICEFWHSLS